MPKLNFPQIPDAEDYSLIPEGKYRMKVFDVQTDKNSSEGYEMWVLVLEIVEGEFKGRKVFDRIFFHNEKVVSRVKLICHRLGMDVSKSIDLTPRMLLHRQARMKVLIKPYEKDGEWKKSNKVDFSGYEALGVSEAAVEEPEIPEQVEAPPEEATEPVFVDQEGTEEESPF
jgi:hypothetical protein